MRQRTVCILRTKHPTTPSKISARIVLSSGAACLPPHRTRHANTEHTKHQHLCTTPLHHCYNTPTQKKIIRHTHLLQLQLGVVLDAELDDQPRALALRRPLRPRLPRKGRVVVHLPERRQRLPVVGKLHEAVALAGGKLRRVLCCRLSSRQSHGSRGRAVVAVSQHAYCGSRVVDGKIDHL